MKILLSGAKLATAFVLLDTKPKHHHHHDKDPEPAPSTEAGKSASTAKSDNYCNDVHLNSVSSTAPLTIGVVTSKHSKKFITERYIPFASKHTPATGVERLFFTNEAWEGVPSVVDNDSISSYQTAQVRFLNTVRYMAHCRKDSRWFFMHDDDAAVSANRVQAFTVMMENQFGSPDTVQYLLGRRNPWLQHYYNGTGLRFFGGDGLLLSRAMLERIRKIPASVWEQQISSMEKKGTYEGAFYNMLHNQGSLDMVQRGPFPHRPFGFGPPKTEHANSFCRQNETQWFDVKHALFRSDMQQLKEQFGQNVLDTVFIVHKLDRNLPIPPLLNDLFSHKTVPREYGVLLCDWQYIANGPLTHDGCGKCSDQTCINSWKVACPTHNKNLLEDDKPKKDKDKGPDIENFADPASTNQQDDVTPSIPATPEKQPILNIWLTARERPDGMIAWNRKYVPANTHFHYYNDHDMEASVRHISMLLEQENAVHGAFQAWSQLRPPAFKADMWRAMILWQYGGMYMDHKILLTKPISDWVNVNEDQLILPRDIMMVNGRWAVQSALMFAKAPRHRAWVVILNHIVSNIHKRYYGYNIKNRWYSVLAITGPVAYEEAIRDHPDLHPKRDVQLVAPKNKKGKHKFEGRAYDTQYVLVSDPKHVIAITDHQLHSKTGSSYWNEWHNHHVYVDDNPHKQLSAHGKDENGLHYYHHHKDDDDDEKNKLD